MQPTRIRRIVTLSSLLVAALAWSQSAIADDHIRGVIAARGNNGTVMVNTDDASNLTVVLKDFTKVRRSDGVGDHKVSAAALIPGLRVRASGDYDSAKRFVARRVTFNKSDMKMAQAIRGGVSPTDLRSLDNQKRSDDNARVIDQQQQILARQTDQIATNADRIRANQDRIVGTTGALAATNARITNLDEYQTISAVTIYFRNGQSRVDGKSKDQLQQLVKQTQGMRGFVIQVQGYASNVGPLALNQTISRRRAEAVTAELQQSGIAPTNIVVPAAMGIDDQVATNKTAAGQAENRRTVVTLLKNSGITAR